MSSSYSHLPSNLNFNNFTNPNTINSNNYSQSNREYLNNSQNNNFSGLENKMSSKPQHNYTPMNNQLYTQNSKPSSTVSNSSNKLTQMSSDLAKLKQQLSKIMNQTDKFEKKNINSTQLNSSRLNTSQQNTQVSHESNLITTSKSYQNNMNLQQKNPLIFNTKINQNFSPSQRKSVAQQNYQSQIKPSQKINYPISKPKDKEYSTNYLPEYERKTPKLETYQSQKNLFFTPTKYFTDNATFQKILNENIETKDQKKFASYEQKISEVKPKLRIKDQFEVINNRPMEANKQKYQQSSSIPQFQPAFKKKSSSNLSHEIIVNQIVSEQLSKKIQLNFQAQQLRKKKQQQQLQYQQKIIELEHQKRKIKHQLNNIMLEKDNIQTQLKNQKMQKESLLKKYNQLEQLHKINKNQLQNYRTKCKLLQKKLQNQISRPKTTQNQTLSFDQSLKQQLVQIKKYKDQLEEKDQEINRVKDLNTANRRQIDSLHNQIKIQQLKAASQVNQCQLKNSILIQDKQNQIKTFKNLITTLEAKLQVAVKENKSKDAFMIQHLTGKVKTQDDKKYIESFFKDYATQFPINKIGQKIREQQIQIERLKKTILQMASIKK